MGISLHSQCFFCFICILLIFCITNGFTHHAYSQCLEDQRTLLLELKNDLIFNSTLSRKLVLWNQTQDCCTWNGVECDGTGHVISLQLDGEGISGGIHNSSSLSGLRYLKRLNLADNDFGGVQIPEGILNLKNLTHLDLSNACFGGQVPIEVSLMRRLVNLDLSSFFSNYVLKVESPNLKMLLQNLTGLRELYLDGVNISAQGSEWCQAISSSLPELRILSLCGCSLSVSNFFANFSYLTTLSLSGCGLNSIPQSLFSLPSLKTLILSDNRLSGRLYEFPTLQFSNIVELDLSDNRLEGQIPESFFTLERLEFLILSQNFFNGTVPLEKFQRLQYLGVLDLSYNNLFVDTSITDTSLSMFPQLYVLGLASCNLDKFPDLINQHKLVYLDLSNNRITGEVPNWIWEIGNGTLYSLNLSSNLLVGLQKPYHIPSSLRILDVHSNLLHGELPPVPLYAYYIDYSHNNFEKSIPLNIGNSTTKLLYLSLANNSLSGAIPTSFCNATLLKVLDMSANKLSGTIPPCLVQNLKQLGNYLERSLPVSLANCKSLRVLNVGNNNIDDGFPCMLASSLRVLVLRSNRFHGQVRCSRSWSNLQIIDIASNNFSGYLYTKSFSGMMLEKHARLESDYIHYNSSILFSDQYYAAKVIIKGVELEFEKILTTFTVIDFSCNNFQGEIPDAIGDLSSLQVLNLSHNTFAGTIPKSLGNLTQLGSLDLSTNQLRGEIPKELTCLTFLGALNLSNNQLIGPIPSGPQLQTFSTDSFQGNTGLCGFPLNISCRHTGENDNVPPPNSYRKDEAINWDYVSVALGYVVGLGSIFWLLFFCRSFKHKFNDQTEHVFEKVFNPKGRRKRHRGRVTRRC
ncbi:Receptor-like protein 35 [Sesamum angolense]|uniref:Receptor-like protein 35 n=1 Tax=Sesamum angolense TaxID=2727404 RepID=A0AAE1X992_9LAMI|nr:Receptor-like protein 35 [Sesamum angolense]